MAPRYFVPNVEKLDEEEILLTNQKMRVKKRVR
jgi:hypothetical protein